MEEVDKIIIFTLKSFNCEIEDDVVSLKQLSSELFVEAAIKLIQAIDPTFEKSKIIPTSMSAKYRYCAELSDKIKALGFHGDIGYQTFLYGNEIEIRRILMFLIEKLPREQVKISSPTKTKIDILKERISKAIAEKSVVYKSSPFISLPLETGIVKPGQTKMNMSPRDWREYCVNQLKPLPLQVNREYLLPSIISLNASDMVEDTLIYPVAENAIEQSQSTNKSNSRVSLQTDQDKLTQRLETELEELEKLTKESKLIQQVKDKEELKLSQTRKSMDVEEKVNIMLPEADEYFEKLKEKIDKGHEKLKQMEEQWEEMKPSIEKKCEKVRRESDIQQHYDQLAELRETARVLKKEYEAKSRMYNELNESLPKKSVNRSFYTKRLLEIINNIKKQDADALKIIADTKQVQKQLNKVNGKIERCFTLMDEMIFRDTVRDEAARKAYKFLVTLHTDCSDIVKTVQDIGNIKKEMKTLEDQIDALYSKNIHENLDQIQTDIEHMRNESAVLAKEI